MVEFVGVLAETKTMNQMGISWRWHDHVCCLHRHYIHSLLFLLAAAAAAAAMAVSVPVSHVPSHCLTE